MNVTPTIANTVKQAPPAQSLPLLGQNLWKLVRHGGDALLQNPGKLRDNGLIAASLILVVSRVAVANASALQSKGKPDGPFRYIQAIQTTMREVLGVTLSFLVVRMAGEAMRFGMRRFFHTPLTPAGPGLWSELGKQLKQFATRTQRPLPALAELETHLPFKCPTPQFDQFQLDGFKWGKIPLGKRLAPVSQAAIEGVDRFGSWLEKFRNQNASGALFDVAETTAERSLAQKYKTFYRYAPEILGSLFIAIPLSGLWLEWFSVNRSEQVVKGISKHLSHKAPPPPPPASAPQAKGLPSPLAASNAFNPFEQQPTTTAASSFAPHSLRFTAMQQGPFKGFVQASSSPATREVQA